MRTVPFKKRLLILAGLVIASQLVACSGPTPTKSLVNSTVTPQALINPDNTQAAIPNNMFILEDPFCTINNFGKLGNGNFPYAIPEGGILGLNCVGNEQKNAVVHYDEQTFNTTTYIMGPDGNDNLTRMGEIGRDLRKLPADPSLTDCSVEAFAAPIGNGGPDFTNHIDLSAGGYVVAPITTVGNTRSIFAEDLNGGIPGFPIHPQSLDGAGGPPYTDGFLEWALFDWETDAIKGTNTLNFEGILKPDHNCPVYIGQPGN